MATPAPPMNQQRWYLFTQRLQLNVDWQLELHILRTKFFFYGILLCTALFAGIAGLEGFADAPGPWGRTFKTALWFIQVLCGWGFWSHVVAMSFAAGHLGPSLINALNGLPVISGLTSPWDEVKHKAFSKQVAYAMTLANTPLTWLLLCQTRGWVAFAVIGALLAVAMKLMAFGVGEKWRPIIERATLFAECTGLVLLLITGMLANAGMTWWSLWETTGFANGQLSQSLAWWRDLPLLPKAVVFGMVVWLVSIIANWKTAGDTITKWLGAVIGLYLLFAVQSCLTGLGDMTRGKMASTSPASSQPAANQSAGVAIPAPTPIAVAKPVATAKSESVLWPEVKTTDAKQTGNKWEFSLDSRAMNETAINVPDGAHMSITVTGTVRPDKDLAAVTADSGWSIPARAVHKPEQFPLPSGRFGQPLLVIGNTVYPLDGEASLQITKGGNLSFLVNDRGGLFADNTGTYKVTVELVK